MMQWVMVVQMCGGVSDGGMNVCVCDVVYDVVCDVVCDVVHDVVHDVVCDVVRMIDFMLFGDIDDERMDGRTD